MIASRLHNDACLAIMVHLLSWQRDRPWRRSIVIRTTTKAVARVPIWFYCPGKSGM
jgi:hypothetical protein